MNLEDSSVTSVNQLRPVIGLTHGLAGGDVEILTVNAIRMHRRLVERADQLFQALPENHKVGKTTGGKQHLEYIEAMIEMHAQMNALNTLLEILGYVPTVSVN